MDWTNKVYEELSEFEKFKADKLIDQSLDSTSDYKGNPPTEHDRIVIRDYIRENLSMLNRVKEQKKISLMAFLFTLKRTYVRYVFV
ncbi:XRE family transcriptional regulator [Enterococcus gallinarum]|uniref:XRE family transcriptional regulator n=1 Tax=Enterococcus gallinarum TaxID=1353 RepID=UPI0035DDC9D0